MIHSHPLTDTHSPNKFTLYAFIHRCQNIGSCKISPSCPCAGLNQQPRGPVSIQAKLPGRTDERTVERNKEMSDEERGKRWARVTGRKKQYSDGGQG
ncbi:hypothetical protein GBF38_007750 [Nibea albiflora]|uniref:Uncharacterized protein n=1 Tax=Nibea albiflora TaxID=240163 RepID=A0ACB7EP10_NIBAL|nr:hypothetical protein GBF38_007750 [Nibea albiflora]